MHFITRASPYAVDLHESRRSADTKLDADAQENPHPEDTHDTDQAKRHFRRAMTECGKNLGKGHHVEMKHALEDTACIDPHATKQWVDKIKKAKESTTDL